MTEQLIYQGQNAYFEKRLKSAWASSRLVACTRRTCSTKLGVWRARRWSPRKLLGFWTYLSGKTRNVVEYGGSPKAQAFFKNWVGQAILPSSFRPLPAKIFSSDLHWTQDLKSVLRWLGGFYGKTRNVVEYGGSPKAQAFFKNATWRWQWAHLVICTCHMHNLKEDPAQTP